ncbi:MAG: EpsG family protein [Prevotella sp.]|nr:EpsG family protein [Prevotella sp.]
MSIFYLIFVILAVYFSFRYDGIEEYDSHKQHRLWLMCGYLICLSGFSYGLGADKFTYMDEFEELPSNFSETGDYIWIQFMLRGQMPLWTLANILAKAVFHSFYALQLMQSTAINMAVCYIVSKYTNRYFLFLLVYFFSLQYFVFNTEVMREGFAMAFALIGMHQWMSGKRWLFFFMFPIALLFHVSAVTMLLFPFIRFRISWMTLAIAFFAAFCIWLFSDLVLGKVMVSVLGGMGALVQKVLFYSFRASTIFGFLRSAITYLIFPFVIMYSATVLESSYELRKRKEKIISYMVALGILASSLAGFARLYNYVQIFYLIMLADFIYMLFRVKNHLIIRLGALAGTLFLIILRYMTPYQATNIRFYDFFYPYTCILHEDKNVYIRAIAHQEALATEEKDNNVREIE